MNESAQERKRSSGATVLATIALMVMLSFTVTAAFAQSTHQIVLLDTSGSMKAYYENAENVKFLRQGLLTNTMVIHTGDQVVVRGFHSQAEPARHRAEDAMRLWPTAGPPAKLDTKEQLERLAMSVIPRLDGTGGDTDLPQAIELALTDRAAYFPDELTYLWLVTDNWQDVGGSGAGMDRFYTFLGSDPQVHGVFLIPLIRNADGVDGNLVLYGIAVAPETDYVVTGDLYERMKPVATAALACGFQQADVIAASGSQIRPPQIATRPAPEFRAQGGSQANLTKEGSLLSFDGLNLGEPLFGSLGFHFESPMREWRIQEAKVHPVVLSFSHASQARLRIPESVSVYVTPPVIDTLRPGGKSATQFEAIFPASGLFTPELESRPFRHFFPGGQGIIEGNARFTIDLNLENGVVLDDERLADLVGRVRMIDGIRRTIQAEESVGETLRREQTYSTRYIVRINDGFTYLGPFFVTLIIIILGILAILILRPVTVLYGIDGNQERRAKVSTASPALIQFQGKVLGKVVRRISGALWFLPVKSPLGEERNKPVKLTRAGRERTVNAKESAFQLRLRIK